MLIIVIKNQVLHNVPSIYVLNCISSSNLRTIRYCYLFVLVKNETTCFGPEISMAIFSILFF